MNTTINSEYRCILIFFVFIQNVSNSSAVGNQYEKSI